MKTRAAVLRELGKSFEITELDLDAPKTGESTDPAPVPGCRIFGLGCVSSGLWAPVRQVQ